MNKAFDRAVSIIFLGIGAFVVVESQHISQSSYGSNVGSSAFPIGLGLILILLGIRNFYETFRASASPGSKGSVKLEYKKFLIILGSTAAYIFLLEPLGFVISTFLFLLAGFQTMDKTGIWKSTAISAAISMGIYYIFVDIMNGTLPALPDWLGI